MRLRTRRTLVALQYSRRFAVLSLVISSCVITSAAAAQTIVKWDTSRFDQPGQRSLFLRTSNGGHFGLTLGAGDVDGDGSDDFLLCPLRVSEAFLFFSPPDVPAIQEAVPAPGVVTRIAGAQSLGVECSAGDVNGDGLDDLVLGAPNVTAPGRTGAGAVYVVFGTASLPAEVDVEQPGNALKIVGLDAGDHLGVWVDVVDVDGDGVGDILAGAPDADGPGNSRLDAGEAYVIFGGLDMQAGVAELSAIGAVGRLLTVFGADSLDRAGSALDAGLIDGGPAADLVVGSALNRAAQAAFGGSMGGGDGPAEDRPNAGEAAILFNPVRGQTLDLAAPPADAAFVFGADPADFAGEEVDVGDADGDGFGDVLIGALTADGPGNLRGRIAGEAYLVYGGDVLHGQRIDLANPAPGVTTIFGPSAGGITGDAARFIDIDGDGRSDVFIGSPTGTFVGPDGRTRTGGLFFIRSPAARLPAVIDLDRPPLESLPVGVILAADPGDILSYSLVRARARIGSGDDVVVNGMTADGLNNQFVDAGEAYVIEGRALAAALAPFATGDVNADGQVDIRDLQKAIVALVAGSPLSDAERRAADTNGNDILDAGDVIGLVDRILLRNVLAPGTGRTASLAKDLGTPGYRYLTVRREALGTGVLSPTSRQLSGIFSLAHPSHPSRSASRSLPSGRDTKALVQNFSTSVEGPSSLSGILATFSLPPGGEMPAAVVPLSGVHVFSGVRDGRLRVLALADGVLPIGEPLFGFRGAGPRLEDVTAATRGGSLRVLQPAQSPGVTKRTSRVLRKGDPRFLEP